jgi:anti-anti-sigma factor
LVPLASHLAGEDSQLLVVALPNRVAEEHISAIRSEVSRRIPQISGCGVILDFTAVDLINSMGITCLLNVDDECRRRKAGLMLAGVSPLIRAFFAQLKLDKRFRMADSVDDAVDALQLSRGH